MTSLFEPTGAQLPPHTYRPRDEPWVWVADGDSWYEGILWGWTWDPEGNAHWGYVDYWVGRRHRLLHVHQDAIRPHQEAPR